MLIIKKNTLHTLETFVVGYDSMACLVRGGLTIDKGDCDEAQDFRSVGQESR